jgi:hypothetical protein
MNQSGHIMNYHIYSKTYLVNLMAFNLKIFILVGHPGQNSSHFITKPVKQYTCSLPCAKSGHDTASTGSPLSVNSDVPPLAFFSK